MPHKRASWIDTHACDLVTADPATYRLPEHNFAAITHDMDAKQMVTGAFATFAFTVPALADVLPDTPADAQAYVDRIAELDDAGPEINAVIVYDAQARETAVRM